MGLMYPRLHGILSKPAPFCSSINWVTNRFSLYEFENNLNLGEDTQGSLNLTNINGVTQVAGKVGFAANFVRASSQNLEVLFTGATFDLTQSAWTIACWVKIDTSTSGGETVFRVIEPTSKESVIALESIAPDNLRGVFRDRNLVSFLALDYNGINTNTWNHFALVRDGSSGLLYMNGVAGGVVGGNTPTVPNLVQEVTDELRVFRGNNVYADGDIDQLATWNRALSSEEVDCLYNSGNGRAI